eukprot:TRINITY_DN67365_c4_g1_i1.p1 TRINITY_DN67365_c4_g1~~TRINITY_DN67365_c4_g1_i1.p1  ORF type:complete len:589 (-),score=374.74 TRINITY_DN67365_c4_g1_i1:475-2016(-)
MREAQKDRLKAMQASEALNTRLNMMKLLSLHRKLMREEKLDELKREIEVLSQQHQREVDRKDALIQTLVMDLDEAEQQFQTAQRTHMGRLDKFVQLHNERLSKLEREFERDLAALKREFETERANIVAYYEREMAELRGITQAIEQTERERLEKAKEAHEAEREEIRNKNLEDINVLRIILENRIEELERQFDLAHQNYVDHTDAANRNFKKLQKRDKIVNRQIDKKRKLIQKLQMKLASWKKTIVQNDRECVARNTALRQQKEAIQKHCQEVKLKMKRLRQQEQQRLKDLALLSREALQKNEEHLAKAERLFKLMEMARKLETEKERVMPFYETSLTAEQQEQVASETQRIQQIAEQDEHVVKTAKMRTGADGGSGGGDGDANGEAKMQQFMTTTVIGPDGQPVSANEHLELFYRRYNKVLLDKLAIEQEKQRLQEENESLQAALKQYLEGISITPDVMDKANPLLIVNNRVNVLPAAGQEHRVRRVPVVIEASNVVNSYAAHSRVSNSNRH